MRIKQKTQESSYSQQQIQEDDLSSGDPIKSDHFRHKKRSRWTPEQNIRYAYFLKENIGNFKTTILRKKCSVFCQLSKYMKNRTTVQAKSHHQKMIKRHGQVQKIIEYIQRRFLCKIDPRNDIYEAIDQKPQKSCQIEEKSQCQKQEINKNTYAAKIEGPDFFWDDEVVQNNQEWFQDI